MPPTCFADRSKSDFLNNPRSISCRFRYHSELEEIYCIIYTASKANNYCIIFCIKEKQKETYTVVAVQSEGRAGNQKNEPKRHKLKPHDEMSERKSSSENKQFTSILIGLMRCTRNCKDFQDLLKHITHKV